jgi:hypothetical protein
MVEETQEQYTERLMDEYGAASLEELHETLEGIDLGYEEFRLSELTDLIRTGKKPSKKDIAYALRTYGRVAWPEELREYTAQVLLGEIKYCSKKTLFSNDGSVNTDSRALKSFETMSYTNRREIIISKGLKKTEALEVLCKAILLGLVHFNHTEKEAVDALDLESIEQKWSEYENSEQGIESIEELYQKIRQVREIIHPQNR